MAGAARRVACLLGSVAVFAVIAFAVGPLASSARADIEWPPARISEAVTIRADWGSHWQQGAYDVWHLRGRCWIKQDRTLTQAREAVLWIRRADPGQKVPHKVICYLEGEVVIDHRHSGQPHVRSGKAAQSQHSETWLGRFHTTAAIDLQVRQQGAAAESPAVHRAIQARDHEIQRPLRQAQFQAPAGTLPPPTRAFQQPGTGPELVDAPQANTLAIGDRRIVVRGRSNVRPQAELETDPNTNETVVIFKNGVRATVEGVQPTDLGQLGTVAGDINTITLEADRLVLWAPRLEELRDRSETMQDGQVPLEIYLEGNIVFVQGGRRIFADRMYYDVANERGVVLAAELLTPVEEYQGLLRLKADVLQVQSRQRVEAYSAAATTSLLGVPRYWFQSERIELVDRPSQEVDPRTGLPVLDASGQPKLQHDYLATSRNNFVYAAGVPIFYWPTLATDLSKPTFYLDQLSVKNDNVFGTQILADWDVYQLLGVRNPPSGTDWTVTTDFLSERGFGLGTRFTYDRPDPLLLPGSYNGFIDAWGIHDSGLDNLGEDRREVPLEESLRGRVLARHRHRIPGGWQLTGEFGWISDRNFLEQYYEQEWDQLKDLDTGLELKRIFDNQSISIAADVRVNDFFTQTESLPRADHFILGQPFLFDWFTWHAHSQAGYLKLKTGEPPTNPVDAAKFDPLAWESDVEGVRLQTRQQVDLPLSLGPVKLVPYAMGEVLHEGEDLLREDVTRVYGQLGVRSSLPFWRADPKVRSTLLNLNGLAHKVTIDSEFLWAEGNRDLAQFPLYDELDDDSIEFFRRRFFFDTFGGVPGGNVPTRFDERFFALRQGLQSWVASPTAEVADDLMMARFGLRQRLQTKRGLPGQERIVDWMVLDIEAALFPQPERDNLGQEFGMLDYEFRWHVGDRLTVLSDGYADFFGDGLRTFSLGGVMSRPQSGRLYVGFRTIEGPISSNVLTTSLSYRMSEKWIGTVGAAYDFAATGNIGQRVTLTRIGESWLVRLGLNVDASRGNVGAVLALEPRFFPKSRTARFSGVTIPPLGSEGFE